MIILNSALYKYEIDLRLVINGFQKPLKRFVHRDNPHNPHYTVFQNLYCGIRVYRRRHFAINQSRRYRTCKAFKKLHGRLNIFDSFHPKH
jgi:hypothetical protein